MDLKTLHIASGLVACILLAAPTAGAQTGVRAADIIKHFEEQKQIAGGRTRGGLDIDLDAQDTQDEDGTRAVFVGPSGFGDPNSETGVLPATGSSAGSTAGSATTVGTTGTTVGTTATTATAPVTTAGYDLLITFELNSDRLTPEAKRNLEEFVKALDAPSLNDSRFLVEGHTDATGSADYNLDLANRRAAAVVRYLTARGVDQRRLKPQGFGELKPLVDNPRDPRNRRVEARLISE